MTEPTNQAKPHQPIGAAYNVMIAIQDTTLENGAPALNCDILSKTGVLDVDALSTILAVWIAENFDNIVAWARHSHAQHKAAAQAAAVAPEDTVIKGVNPKLLGPDGRVLN